MSIRGFALSQIGRSSVTRSSMDRTGVSGLCEVTFARCSRTSVLSTLTRQRSFTAQTHQPRAVCRDMDVLSSRHRLSASAASIVSARWMALATLFVS